MPIMLRLSVLMTKHTSYDNLLLEQDAPLRFIRQRQIHMTPDIIDSDTFLENHLDDDDFIILPLMWNYWF